MDYVPAMNYLDYVNSTYRFDLIRPTKPNKRTNCINRAIGQIDMESDPVIPEVLQNNRTVIIGAEYYNREGVPIRREKPFRV